MLVRTCIFIFAVIVLTPSTHASDTLTLGQCLTLAKTNSPMLRQTGLNLRAANLARQELNAASLPQFHFGAGASFAPGTRDFGYDPAVSNLGELSGRVILDQLLYDGGRRHIKAIQSEIDISRLTKEQQLAVRDLEFEIRQTFIENLRAQQEVNLREQAVRELSEYLDLVNRLNAGGAASHTDVLRSQIELATATNALSQSSQSLTDAKYQLAGLIGDPADTSFVTGNSLEETSLIQIDSATLAGSVDTSGNLKLSVANLEYERSTAQIKEVQKEKLPTISIGADAGWLTSRENLMLPSSERYRGLGYSIGISLEMPLFDWGGRKLRVQQKQLAAESSQLQAEFIRRSYETEIRTALSQLASARSRLDVLRKAIKQAEDNFLLTKSKYAGGSAVALEVLSAQQLLTETRIAELETLSDIQIDKAKLVRLTGYSRTE